MNLVVSAISNCLFLLSRSWNIISPYYSFQLYLYVKFNISRSIMKQYTVVREQISLLHAHCRLFYLMLHIITFPSKEPYKEVDVLLLTRKIKFWVNASVHVWRITNVICCIVLLFLGYILCYLCRVVIKYTLFSQPTGSGSSLLITSLYRAIFSCVVSTGEYHN